MTTVIEIFRVNLGHNPWDQSNPYWKVNAHSQNKLHHLSPTPLTHFNVVSRGETTFCHFSWEGAGFKKRNMILYGIYHKGGIRILYIEKGSNKVRSMWERQISNMNKTSFPSFLQCEFMHWKALRRWPILNWSAILEGWASVTVENLSMFTAHMCSCLS